MCDLRGREYLKYGIGRLWSPDNESLGWQSRFWVVGLPPSKNVFSYLFLPLDRRVLKIKILFLLHFVRVLNSAQKFPCPSLCRKYRVGPKFGEKQKKLENFSFRPPTTATSAVKHQMSFFYLSNETPHARIQSKLHFRWLFLWDRFLREIFLLCNDVTNNRKFQVKIGPMEKHYSITFLKN